MHQRWQQNICAIGYIVVRIKFIGDSKSDIRNFSAGYANVNIAISKLLIF